MLTSLAIIFLLGLLMGSIFNKLKLPSLMGMIFTGILLSPYAFNLLDDKILSISSDLRQLALVIILTRAGLSLDIKDLKKVGRPAILMCFVPAIFHGRSISRRYFCNSIVHGIYRTCKRNKSICYEFFTNSSVNNHGNISWSSFRDILS